MFILEIWRFEKRIALSGKKPPLVQSPLSTFFFHVPKVVLSRDPQYNVHNELGQPPTVPICSTGPSAKVP